MNAASTWQAPNTESEGYPLPPLVAGEVCTVDFHLNIPTLYSTSLSFSPAVANGTLDRFAVCDWIDNAVVLQMTPPEGPMYGHFRFRCRVEVNSRIGGGLGVESGAGASHPVIRIHRRERESSQGPRSIWTSGPNIFHAMRSRRVGPLVHASWTWDAELVMAPPSLASRALASPWVLTWPRSRSLPPTSSYRLTESSAFCRRSASRRCPFRMGPSN